MPQGKTTEVRITTVELAKGSYAGYLAGMTYHRGHPLPASPLSKRWSIRMQGETDAFWLLDGEGDPTNQYLTDYEKFTTSAIAAEGETFVGPNKSKKFYVVAPADASAAMNVNVIEEA